MWRYKYTRLYAYAHEKRKKCIYYTKCSSYPLASTETERLHSINTKIHNQHNKTGEVSIIHVPLYDQNNYITFQFPIIRQIFSNCFSQFYSLYFIRFLKN